jgi:hypothetical protein
MCHQLTAHLFYLLRDFPNATFSDIFLSTLRKEVWKWVNLGKVELESGMDWVVSWGIKFHLICHHLPLRQHWLNSCDRPEATKDDLQLHISVQWFTWLNALQAFASVLSSALSYVCLQYNSSSGSAAGRSLGIAFLLWLAFPSESHLVLFGHLCLVHYNLTHRFVDVQYQGIGSVQFWRLPKMIIVIYT